MVGKAAKSNRIPYDYNAEKVDVKSELEELRRHYAQLQHNKQKKKGMAKKKAMNAKPSEAHLRLYKEGMYKVCTSKFSEEMEKKNPISHTVSSRNTSPALAYSHFQNQKNKPTKSKVSPPSPVYDRLYKHGMRQKLHQYSHEGTRDQPSPSSSRKILTKSSSDVCDRLYLDGIKKLTARNAGS